MELLSSNCESYDCHVINIVILVHSIEININLIYFLHTVVATWYLDTDLFFVVKVSNYDNS